ncbi:MAG: tetratricopeptide repeat protein [Legionellales bacterium]
MIFAQNISKGEASELIKQWVKEEPLKIRKGYEMGQSQSKGVQNQSGPGDALDYCGRGAIYLNRGNYAAALADYTTAIEKDPNCVRAYCERGYTYSKQENYAAALADYTRAIEKDPNYDLVYFNRGNTYSKQDNYAAALADYTTAIEKDPNYYLVYFNRGNTYYKQDNYAGYKQDNYAAAVADYTTAIEKKPNYVQAYFNRGYINGKQGNYAAALADYITAIEKDPNYARAYCERGNTHYKQGNYAAALVDFKSARRLNPKKSVDVATDILTHCFKNNAWLYDKLKPELSFRQRLSVCSEGNAIPETFTDFTSEIMNNPIAVSSGNIFDRGTLEQLFIHKGNPETVPCPITRDPIHKRELTNATLIYIKKDIEAFVTEQESLAKASQLVADANVSVDENNAGSLQQACISGQNQPWSRAADSSSAAASSSDVGLFAASKRNQDRAAIARQAWLDKVEAKAAAASSEVMGKKSNGLNGP